MNIWGDPRVPNNDGIDIDSSADVLITHTNVSTLDDAICVKSNDSEAPFQIVFRREQAERCKHPPEQALADLPVVMHGPGCITRAGLS